MPSSFCTSSAADKAYPIRDHDTFIEHHTLKPSFMAAADKAYPIRDHDTFIEHHTLKPSFMAAADKE
jgi:hypothetical protein